MLLIILLYFVIPIYISTFIFLFFYFFKFIFLFYCTPMTPYVYDLYISPFGDFSWHYQKDTVTDRNLNK